MNPPDWIICRDIPFVLSHMGWIEDYRAGEFVVLVNPSMPARLVLMEMEWDVPRSHVELLLERNGISVQEFWKTYSTVTTSKR